MNTWRTHAWSLSVLEKLKQQEAKSKTRDYRRYEVFRKKLSTIRGGTVENIVKGLSLIEKFYNPTKVFKKTDLTTPRYFHTKDLTISATGGKVGTSNTGKMNSGY